VEATTDPSAAIVLLGSLPALEPDCACPTPPPPSGTAARAPGERWVRGQELYAAPLAEGWMLYCNELLGGAPAVLNTPAEQRLALFETPQPLSDAVDAALAEARLLTPAGTQPAAPQGRPAQLTAWLHVTNACNLDCPYCYVRKSGAKMSLETGLRAIDSLVATARLHGFTALKLKYAGGEAALHFRLIQQLHAYASAQTREHNLELRAVVLSNGTVMPTAFADWLATSGARLMLSVDGVGDSHDEQRPLKGGGAGAFAALERNLHERLLPRGIRPDISITVTGRSAQRAHEAVAWALRQDLPFSLNFYRENEQSASYRQLRYEEQQLIEGILNAYRVIEDALPPWPFLDGLLDRVQAEAHSHTCGVGESYVVITHEGRVAQCQMALDYAQPFTPETDLIALVAAGPIHNVPVDEKAGCHCCPWRYRCAGGCPLVTLRATGRTDVRSPNCSIYKALIPAALRLEGLRLLKIAKISSA
jgi:uncharacterized protein